jgi:hypothetical protein
LYVTLHPEGGATGFHSRFAVLLDTDITARPVGVDGYAPQGDAKVVTLTGELKAETLPALSRARTANEYVVEAASPVAV